MIYLQSFLSILKQEERITDISLQIVFTIFDDDVDNISRTESLLPAAGHSLTLVVQQLDGVVHQLCGLK